MKNDINTNVTRTQQANVLFLEKQVAKAIAENCPQGFKNATDEQVKKTLVNILFNFSENESRFIDCGRFEPPNPV